MAAPILRRVSLGASMHLSVSIPPQWDDHFTAGAIVCTPNPGQICLGWADSVICPGPGIMKLDKPGAYQIKVNGFFNGQGQYSAGVELEMRDAAGNQIDDNNLRLLRNTLADTDTLSIRIEVS